MQSLVLGNLHLRERKPTSTSPLFGLWPPRPYKALRNIATGAPFHSVTVEADIAPGINHFLNFLVLKKKNDVGHKDIAPTVLHAVYASHTTGLRKNLSDQ